MQNRSSKETDRSLSSVPTTSPVPPMSSPFNLIGGYEDLPLSGTSPLWSSTFLPSTPVGHSMSTGSDHSIPSSFYYPISPSFWVPLTPLPSPVSTNSFSSSTPISQATTTNSHDQENLQPLFSPLPFPLLSPSTPVTISDSNLRPASSTSQPTSTSLSPPLNKKKGGKRKKKDKDNNRKTVKNKRSRVNSDDTRPRVNSDGVIIGYGPTKLPNGKDAILQTSWKAKRRKQQKLKTKSNNPSLPLTPCLPASPFFSEAKDDSWLLHVMQTPRPPATPESSLPIPPAAISDSTAKSNPPLPNSSLPSPLTLPLTPCLQASPFFSDVNDDSWVSHIMQTPRPPATPVSSLPISPAAINDTTSSTSSSAPEKKANTNKRKKKNKEQKQTRKRRITKPKLTKLKLTKLKKTALEKKIDQGLSESEIKEELEKIGVSQEDYKSNKANLIAKGYNEKQCHYLTLRENTLPIIESLLKIHDKAIQHGFTHDELVNITAHTKGQQNLSALDAYTDLPDTVKTKDNNIYLINFLSKKSNSLPTLKAFKKNIKKEIGVSDRPENRRLSLQHFIKIAGCSIGLNLEAYRAQIEWEKKHTVDPGQRLSLDQLVKVLGNGGSGSKNLEAYRDQIEWEKDHKVEPGRRLSLDQLVDILSHHGGSNNLDAYRDQVEWEKRHEVEQERHLSLDQLVKILGTDGGSKNLEAYRKQIQWEKEHNVEPGRYLSLGQLVKILSYHGGSKKLTSIRNYLEKIIEKKLDDSKVFSSKQLQYIVLHGGSNGLEWITNNLEKVSNITPKQLTEILIDKALREKLCAMVNVDQNPIAGLLNQTQDEVIEIPEENNELTDQEINELCGLIMDKNSTYTFDSKEMEILDNPTPLPPTLGTHRPTTPLRMNSIFNPPPPPSGSSVMPTTSTTFPKQKT